MTDLRKVFAEEIKKMMEAADANVVEARENLAHCNEEVDRCSVEYEKLQTEANQAQAKFGESAKAVRRMGRMQNGPAVEAVERAEIPLEQYKRAASQLPEASKALADAKYSLDTADKDLERALAEADILKYLA